jgi:hypothetical protein
MDEDAPHGERKGDQARPTRLIAALRANLRRRKAQARDRTGSQSEAVPFLRPQDGKTDRDDG